MIVLGYLYDDKTKSSYEPAHSHSSNFVCFNLLSIILWEFLGLSICAKFSSQLLKIFFVRKSSHKRLGLTFAIKYKQFSARPRK